MTNADKIRKMTDEELEAFFEERSVCGYNMCGDTTDCHECTKKWLKQEVEHE